METLLLASTLIIGFYMAWNIGANDVANAMGTSVGSGALTLRNAVFLAAFMEFFGVFFVGNHVTATVQKGIVDPHFFLDSPETFALGMMAVLLSAGSWLQIASWKGWPVSTTHSIIGALVGFGLLSGGSDAIKWAKLREIFGSWVITPVISGVIAHLVFRLVSNQIFKSSRPLEASKKVIPFLVFLFLSTLSIVLMIKGLSHVEIPMGTSGVAFVIIGIPLTFALLIFILLKRKSYHFEKEMPHKGIDAQLERSLDKVLKHLGRTMERIEGATKVQVEQIRNEMKSVKKSLVVPLPKHRLEKEFLSVEKIFASLQIMSASLMAFSHGANDVANAIGPISAVFYVIQNQAVPSSGSEIQMWIILLGGCGIVLGLASWGWRVIATVGKGITELTPSRGFCAEFGAAITILLASKLGLPISTTHTLIGAILGVGMARGLEAINLTTIRNIFMSWVITIPVGGALAMTFFSLFSFLFSAWN